uniref:Zinc finger protein PLAGL2-like n=1 Tax=Paramormyrops kingsleyae TaxID=1676925 RepID=A0A3B3TGL9_9TELE
CWLGVSEAHCRGSCWTLRIQKRHPFGLGRNQSPLCLLGSQDKLCLQTYCQSGEKAFHCSQPHCAKAFVSKYKLLRHMATHSQQKTHQCSFCEKMFHRKDHLKNHLQTHDPNKEAFRCEECGKRYHTKLGYRRHAAMHSAASGDLTCKVCLLGCESTAALLEHLRGHSGKPPVAGVTRERRHPCAHCDRRFYTRKDVRRHLVVHTGRKDFLCPHCAQRFGRKDHLTRHAKKSHPQEPLEGKAELTPPPNVIKEELSHMSCGGPPRVHPGNKPFAGVFPVGLYDPHLQPAHTSPTGPVQLSAQYLKLPGKFISFFFLKHTLHNPSTVPPVAHRWSADRCTTLGHKQHTAKGCQIWSFHFALP